ncbi:alpha/beta hydrolase [Microbulbifer elongatus]|uniref:Alpha/beta hydrolase n=1 Tax=Microbulbifer elongatus TaxID=86173 RepID=A0ABT1NZE5_9GAMM|nr:alpha/beta hydrolase-fold protein [Microbulbifer elongatus]MCQ3829257.1 alpha/beta hydrolase [Microbulbifer elongatus]
MSVLLSACDVFKDEESKMTGAKPAPLDFLPALSGDYFRFDSEQVGRPYHIYIRLPEDYADSSQKQYPIIYLLDGDSLFPILAANHMFLHYDDDIPEAIVVGIAYGGFDPETNWRDFDFSTYAADWKRSGGAEAFHNFLEHELLPEVESRYRADTERRVLFGQSRGGFMALYSAFNHPDLFWARIASNPSFLPDGKQFFEEPKLGKRGDLMVIVASSSEDRYTDNRTRSFEWQSHWSTRDDAPWTTHLVNIEGGTHAANSTDSYRAALRLLFKAEIDGAKEVPGNLTAAH